MPPAACPSILCIGEVLWDIFPDRNFVGGAPLNVAYHLRALGRDAAIASRIGLDRLGAQTRQKFDELSIGQQLLQTDDTSPTGEVRVALVDAHTPQYSIAQPSAWDHIELTDALKTAAGEAGVIVFGSLAQRTGITRQTIIPQPEIRWRGATGPTIHALLETTRALRVFDANLREPFVDRRIVEASLRHTDLLKINDHELVTFRDWFALPAGDRDAARALCDRFGCRGVCVTRGADGAALRLDGDWHEHNGYRVTAVDPVGAGDAFLAGLIDRLLAGDAADDALAFAGALGAFVASRPSACPPHDPAAIAAIRGG